MMLDIYDEALALHEALRRLGYSADWIYMDCVGGVLEIVLMIPEMPEYRLMVGPADTTDMAELKAKWQERVNRWNVLPHEEAMKIYFASTIVKHGTELIGYLIGAGLYPLEKILHTRN